MNIHERKRLKFKNYSHHSVASFRIGSLLKSCKVSDFTKNFKPVHEISNNKVCATSKASDQPAHTGSLIRASASGLSIL